ncbi:MAG: hypothetical protein JWO55_720 [Candidatus Saccharibacteria bacterium]|nr:hypothetical protein [Candidatus Saccharibacteria bacterium]
MKARTKHIRDFFRKLKVKEPKVKYLFFAELVVFLVVILIFTVKIANYFGVETFKIKNVAENISSYTNKELEYHSQNKLFRQCPDKLQKIDVGRSYVCRSDTEENESVRIYDTYDKISNEREYIYGEAARGNLEEARLLVDESKFDFGRNEPTKIENITWREDPYNDRYWRFNFYGLQALDDLAAGYEKTKDRAYSKKGQDIIHSFASVGVEAGHSWDDNHAVAFRTMSLINYWWKMRQNDALDINTSNEIITLLKSHGTFLADRNHFEAAHNHGVNEAAALLLLAHTFPTLSGANHWKQLSHQRIQDTLNDLIDKDGVLIENSPFYHFYTLRKYWNIYTYAKEQNIDMSPLLKTKIDQMVNYATYILQPNMHPPTIGASLDSEIFYNEEYEEIAHEYPNFKYILTRGTYGKAPSAKNGVFYTAGEAILRSEFSKGFDNHVQSVFHAADYRSDHSHLDALSVTLNSGADRVLIDSGLYAYEDDVVSQYFQGTSAHNTVVVDGKNQRPGRSTLSSLVEKDDTTIASGSHDLYTDVNHSRSAMLIGDHTYVIYDKLTSEDTHTYTQIFHLDSNTNAVKSLKVPSTIEATLQPSNKNFRIRQLGVVDNTEVFSSSSKAPVGGYCSTQYKKIKECPQINYTLTGKTVSFMTVIELKERNQKYTYENNSLSISTNNNKSYKANFSTTASSPVEITPANIKISAVTEQKTNIGLVMKNGSATVDYVRLPLKKYGYKGIVSMPARYLTQHYAYTLSSSELNRLQKNDGWDIVNQGYSKNDDLTAILAENRIDDYESDIVRGALAYRDMERNANPLWFSHAGSVADELSNASSVKYYPLNFALDEKRTADNTASSYNVTDDTTVDEVKQQIDNAINNKQTLMITFTRFNSVNNGDGFYIGNFEEILLYMKKREITASNLTEIAESLGYTLEANSEFNDGKLTSISPRLEIINGKKWYEFWR